MPLRLYNTLSGEKEEFRPLKAGEVSMYHCGPTVYNYAHIGNLRAYVFADVLRRTLEWSGYKIRQVTNITDVGHLSSDADEGEDKMTKALRREGLPSTVEAMREVGEKYARAFFDDLKALNIETSDTKFPRASDHIKEDIDLIKILAEKGFAYRISDGMYFDTAKFPDYGKLGRIHLAGQKEGARVAMNAEKRNPRDFSVWKFNPEIGWDSPWGKGFPGWHVECSAMSRAFLGQPFDIHTGGVDHIPVHHQNEIAQSEAAYGAPLARYWMHSEFVSVADGVKMAKSEENFLTLNSLIEKGFSPLAYRYSLLTAHYRTPVSFSTTSLEAAARGFNRLLETLSLLSPQPEKADAGYLKKFERCIHEDLDTPQALSVFSEAARKNADAGLSDGVRVATVLKMDEILGLDVQNSLTKMNNVPEDITVRGRERERAKQRGDIAEADKIRSEIEKAGYRIVDADGTYAIFKRL